MHIARRAEALLYRQDALIDINGKQLASLASGESEVIDVNPGPLRIAVATSSTGPRSHITFDARPGGEYAVDIGLDERRFDASSLSAALPSFLRASLDAPHDALRPLFQVRARPLSADEPSVGPAMPDGASAAIPAPLKIADRPGPDSYQVWLAGQQDRCGGHIEMIEYRSGVGNYLMKCPDGIGLFRCQAGNCARQR